jgi:hypothetical protein
MATAARIMTDEPDLDGLHSPLRELVAAALAKDPAERPTARQLLDRLLHPHPSTHGTTVVDSVLEDQPDLRAAVHAATVQYAAPGTPSRRHRVRIVVGSAVAAVLLGGATAAAVSLNQDRGAASAAGAASPSPEMPTFAPSSPDVEEWVGELRQSFGSSEPVHLQLAPGADTGAISYPRLGCTGTVSVTRRTSEKIELIERIDTGRCSNRGTIVLWPTGPTTMLLDYKPASSKYTARASMTRR